MSSSRKTRKIRVRAQVDVEIWEEEYLEVVCTPTKRNRRDFASTVFGALLIGTASGIIGTAAWEYGEPALRFLQALIR